MRMNTLAQEYYFAILYVVVGAYALLLFDFHGNFFLWLRWRLEILKFSAGLILSAVECVKLGQQTCGYLFSSNFLTCHILLVSTFPLKVFRRYQTLVASFGDIHCVLSCYLFQGGSLASDIATKRTTCRILKVGKSWKPAHTHTLTCRHRDTSSQNCTQTRASRTTRSIETVADSHQDFLIG